MKKFRLSFLKSLVLGASLLLTVTSCQNVASNGSLNSGSNNNNDSTNTSEIVDVPENNFEDEEEIKGTFNEGVILVKHDNFDPLMLGGVSYTSINPLYKNSNWYKIELTSKEETQDVYQDLKNKKIFDEVSLDYIMQGEAGTAATEISGNKFFEQQKEYFNQHYILDGYEFLKEHSVKPGGSKDVIVAVIDTGVDYNHIDLRKNIWKNVAEIPNNNIDDDNNGYVDDYYGYDFVNKDNDPIDDNGHGTHVAGIIAADNNLIGTVGVAYNTQIMAIKAGNSSGYFNNSDIAEAIQYAYMNGASVINMSFGGSSISLAVEDALKEAYNKCILVAAAGNDSLCNHIGCQIHKENTGVSYPAALPYVIGVMSSNVFGTKQSSFTNFDHYPYDNVEYEVYAAGESILSTWPNNKYAKLNGTSMAAPIVSGIAALLRSYYQDVNTYSNKYIQSQIVNTGTAKPDGMHRYANMIEALITKPTPEVSLFNYYAFDGLYENASNNNNSLLESGETIRVGIELHNRGGVAKNVKATIDTIRNGDESLTDPNFNITVDTIEMSDIGTYSVRDCGLIYDEDDNVTGTKVYFEIKVAENCPNDYTGTFNLNVTYENRMDEHDRNTYSLEDSFELTISSGYVLPRVISEDTVFTNNKLYIIQNDVLIPEGVTVIFEEGCNIQFYADTYEFINSAFDSPTIEPIGTLLFKGTEKNHIKIFPSAKHYNFGCIFYSSEFGTVEMEHCDATNVVTGVFGVNDVNLFDIKSVINSQFDYYSNDSHSLSYYKGGRVESISSFINIIEIIKSKIFVRNFTQLNFDVEGKIVNSLYSSINSAELFTTSSNFEYAENNLFIFGKSLNNAAHNYLSFENSYKCSLINNVFASSQLYTSIVNMKEIQLPKDNSYDSFNNITGNIFLGNYNVNKDQLIKNLFNQYGQAICDIEDYKNHNPNLLFPYIKDIRIKDKNNLEVNTIGRERTTFEIEFSRAMDITQELGVYFGTKEPYADYKIEGAWVSDTLWQGTYELKASIENGRQYFRITNGRAATDHFMTLEADTTLFSFNIDTSQAMAMDLQANPSEKGVELTWAQDDYDTLMGYNIYRSEEKDGNYTRINPTLIPNGENTYIDDTVEPGKTYWYTFKVVLTNMEESNPAGKVSCTTYDSIEPILYHTPVNQGYLNNNLVISCTAKDNVGINKVTLYYRNKGEETYKSTAMLKQNDKYSGTILGSELTLDGLEYYIEASDGNNSVFRGTAENPYSVVIKDDSAIMRVGDVDFDGIIDTKDALMIMQAINGDRILTDDQFKRADLNGNGILESIEALRIIQYVNGKVPTLEM